MKKNIIKQDKQILETFLKNKVPDFIKFNENNEYYDHMVCYEELFGYSHSLLDGHKIDVTVNSFGNGKSIVFDKEYKNILIQLANTTNDLDLQIHCYLSLAVLVILQK